MTQSNSDKSQPNPEQAGGKTPLNLAVSNPSPPLPGNRPIVQTNKDPDFDDFVGYMD